MSSESNKTDVVSRNNPCPYLRALVEEGELIGGTEPVAKITKAIHKKAQCGEGHPNLNSSLIYAVALMSHGLNPISLIKSQIKGIRLNNLRGGPLDKKGVGSGIIDQQGNISEPDLARLRTFAQLKEMEGGGGTELGLDTVDLTAFMDANFARAVGHRRRIDRSLMNGEWPLLLEVMGKEGPNGRYLCLSEVETLIVERQFPDRMIEANAAST